MRVNEDEAKPIRPAAPRVKVAFVPSKLAALPTTPVVKVGQLGKVQAPLKFPVASKSS